MRTVLWSTEWATPRTPRGVVLAILLLAPLLVAASLHAFEAEADDRAVRNALLRALPRYQDIPVSEGREIERIEPYLDDELILHLSDGSTYRVTVDLRSR
jgi:hypothetical protein